MRSQRRQSRSDYFLRFFELLDFFLVGVAGFTSSFFREKDVALSQCLCSRSNTRSEHLPEVSKNLHIILRASERNLWDQ